MARECQGLRRGIECGLSGPCLLLLLSFYHFHSPADDILWITLVLYHGMHATYFLMTREGSVR